ncbi:MAG: phosphoribosylglycinamide formyltransferase [candidate division KSB1 bacterium]|nr:phosphoribosylglycinamide formyltransferase [candidate division KSB1 bacterium]MDZ7346214.1 phosphoribosylglycinamide formyltransferase [candidate division KSB1 bacterium]
MKRAEPLRLAVLASGRGSNLQAILDHIRKGTLDARVVAVISNNGNAGALEIARAEGIPAHHWSRRQFDSDEEYEETGLRLLQECGAELVVLAGYMKIVPERIVRAFQHRILNIHPALLPAFGGKGMYGHFVHQAVIDYGCKVTGVTVHLVDAEYDTGPPVLQRCVPVMDDDDAETLAARVLKVEHEIYSEAIQLFAKDRIRIEGRRVKILPKE